MTADVRSIAALRDWYAALTGYGESLSESLAGVELELRRGFDWLDEQLGRWQKAVRECEEEVVQAKAELSARKFTGWDGREPDTTVQERALRRAKARLEYAEDQVRVVRSWIGRLPKLIDELYRGPASRLGGFLETELPRGLASLGRKVETLETYAGERTDFTGGSGSLPTAPSRQAVSRDAAESNHPSPSGGGAGGGVATSAPAQAGTSADAPNPPGPPSLGGKGGDAPTDSSRAVTASTPSREAAEIKHPSPTGGAAGGGVATSAFPQAERRADAPNPPGPPSLGGKGGDEPPSLPGSIPAPTRGAQS